MASAFVSRALGVAMVLLATAAPNVRAQVVETPQPFDAAGRVMVISAAAAVRLQLGPPGWRITGDFSEARLYSLATDGYVLVVTRRDGRIERYSLSTTDRDALSRQVSAVPAETLLPTDRAAQTRFVISQSLLGLAVYAPTFATAATNGDAAWGASYVLVSGATFFGASQLARDMTITEPMRRLSTHAALTGGATGTGIMYLFNAKGDGRAAGAFIGSLAGTAAGLLLGRSMTPSDQATSTFGANLLGVTAFGLLEATRPDPATSLVLNRGRTAVLMAAGLAGYPLGLRYARHASYNLTDGDIGTLWITGTLGVAAASIPLVNSHPSHTVGALAMTGGLLTGVVVGDRIFARRFDHTRSDATLMALGATAGGLIGTGVAWLVNRDSDNNGYYLAMGTLGAGIGTGAASWFAAPGAEQGRTAFRLDLHPEQALLAAARFRGNFPLVTVTY